MMTELEKLAGKKAALKVKLTEIEKAESIALSKEKEKQSKADSHAKYLLAGAMLAEAKRNPAALRTIKMSMDNLNEKDLAAVVGSSLWAELVPKAP